MSSTGSSVKRRIVRAVDITSQTSPHAPVMASLSDPSLQEGSVAT
jgi:hypothetical protein